MRRFLAIELSIIFICAILTPVAYAVSYKEYYSAGAFTDMMEVDNPLNNVGLSGFQELDKYPYSYGNPDFSAYSLLDDQQKKIYDYVKNAEIGALAVEVPFAIGEFPKANLTNPYFSEIMNAICYDLPELFYHAGYSIDYTYTHTGYVVKIVYNILMYDNTTYSEASLAYCYQEMMKQVDSIPVDTSNRYNFVKSLHDYLCDTIIYPDLDSAYYVLDCHDAYGALVNGYAVCQGYAESFKLICDMFKIPCVYISGTSDGVEHGWNAVQMDDGLWYLIDATFDDQTENPAGQIFYDFFLSGTKTVSSPGFGSTAFDTSHVKDVDMFLPSLKYATDKYSQTNHFTAFQATYNSKVNDVDNYLIRSFFDAKNSNVYYDGMYIDIENPVTNVQFEAPSGVNGSDELWSLVVLGDCNADGSLDALDYSEAVNKVLNDTNISTPFDAACDVSYDGYLDVIDLAVLELLISGKTTDIILE